MNLAKARIALVTFGLLVLPQLVLSQSVVVSYEPTASSTIAEQFESHRALVEELELRRRVNVLFPNPQSFFDGFQVGLVNVGSGNLTFLR